MLRRSFTRFCALAVAFVLFASAPRWAEGATVHEVESGQSLWTIAKRYGVTVDALRAKNGLREDSAIQPGQKLRIPDGKDDSDRSSKRDAKDDGGLAKPHASTQVQKTVAERGGVNPCNTNDLGFGIYDKWDRAPSMGQMISPQRGGVTKSGSFDVMFHFHGHQAVRKEWIKVMDGAVLVGIDLGIGSGAYSAAFQSPMAFERLVESVEAAVAKKTGKKKARARKIGLSAWSAGYGAVQQILQQTNGDKRIDTVLLLDGLHCGYEGDGLAAREIEPFLRFAREASKKRRFMFVSHSSIIPPGYASTTETASYLIAELGGKPRKTKPRGGDPMGLDLVSRYTSGNFHVRGYAGNDKMDHCAHIGLLKDVLKVHVKRRWGSPRGSARKNGAK